MNIKPTNWHARIVHFPTIQFSNKIRMDEECNDFCSYVRWFFIKLLLVIPITLGLTGFYLGLLTADIVAVTTSTFWLEAPFKHVPAFMALIIICSLVLVFALAELASKAYYARKYEKEQERLEKGLPKPEPSFIITLYRKFKDKYCPTVTYE